MESKTEDYKKLKKSKPKCANSGEAHTVNWKGLLSLQEDRKKNTLKKGLPYNDSTEFGETRHYGHVLLVLLTITKRSKHLSINNSTKKMFPL